MLCVAEAEDAAVGIAGCAGSPESAVVTFAAPVIFAGLARTMVRL